MEKVLDDLNTFSFEEAACEQCGECFHRCPELHLPIPVAKKEIESLRKGQDGEFVLQHCTTCFSCNHYCPNQCHPYQLVLKNWNRIYRRRGAPPIYRFICPTMENSIFQMLEKLMTEEEKDLVEGWMNQAPGDTVLLIGNFTHLYPFILGDSRLLDHFTPVDLLDHWEAGATLYQGGYLDVVRSIGKECKRDFDQWKVKTVVPFLDAVEFMLSTVQPEEMGTSFDQEVINFNQWLLGKIENDEVGLSKKLDLTVTLHDNCFSKAGGAPYWDTARKLIQATGCRISEMAHIRENSLCCGFGAGASWRHNFRIPFDILATSRIKLEEAERSGAEALVTYCGGCLYLLWAARELFQSDLKIYHHIELVRMAMGEDLDAGQKLHIKRAWDVITIITFHLLAGFFHRPFKIQKLSFEEQKWKDKSQVFLRVMRKVFDTRIGRYVYRKTFLFLLPRLKTKKK